MKTSQRNTRRWDRKGVTDFLLKDLTWPCHGCGEERPDAAISVLSKEFRTPRGVTGQVNMRYCNDRPACAVRASELCDKMIATLEGQLPRLG